MKHTAAATCRLSPEGWKAKIDAPQVFWASFFEENAKAGETEFEAKITIERTGKNKTLPQLRYLNGVVYPSFLKYLTETAGEKFTLIHLKHVLKTHDRVWFVDEVKDPLTGYVTPIPKSCAKSCAAEMSEYIDSLVSLAYSIGLNIESPMEFYARNAIEFE